MTQPISLLQPIWPKNPDLEPNEQGQRLAQAFIDSSSKSVQALKTPLIEACILRAKYDSLNEDEVNSSRATQERTTGARSSLDVANPAISKARQKEISLIQNAPQIQMAIDKIDEEIARLQAMRSYLAPSTNVAGEHSALQNSPGWSIPD